ncbi:hypothetical protein [Brevundimonas sp.]|uniref:hypothetical protein n=1 Tax=Brevundimonas sp. TaxID=1871086 RepID=UPI003F7100BE
MPGNDHYAAGIAAAVFASMPALASAQTLSGERGGPPAAAVVEILRGEHDARTVLTIYAERASDQTRWRAVLTESNGAVREANGPTCPALADAVDRLERVSLPPVEIRPVQPAEGQRPSPPNLGYLHQSYRLTLRAVSTDGAPVELSLAHGGAGPVRDWFEHVEPTLDPCWRPTP